MNKLNKGDIIEIKEGMTIYASIPEHFVYANKKGIFDLTHTNITITKEFAYLTGKYVVTYTNLEGGSSGHGINDSYPDGHHVFCESLSDRRKIDFYQSGCFTAMLPNIEPVGKAILKYVEDTSND